MRIGPCPLVNGLFHGASRTITTQPEQTAGATGERRSFATFPPRPHDPATKRQEVAFPPRPEPHASRSLAGEDVPTPPLSFHLTNLTCRLHGGSILLWSGIVVGGFDSPPVGESDLKCPGVLR
ncbi:hypothetical protein ANANG_G00319920 [Anguilla anguilla]|uniref:Uncharacterized protein n=1 Tax=Anguilla anguilla TaxID=7936 RepID=A0A9D3LKU5_ANGAN|nr:hypothetical protein ANANG_G00319920 [Anguilla anguilla]